MAESNEPHQVASGQAQQIIKKKKKKGVTPSNGTKVAGAAVGFSSQNSKYTTPKENNCELQATSEFTKVIQETKSYLEYETNQISLKEQILSDQNKHLRSGSNNNRVVQNTSAMSAGVNSVI